MNNPLYFLLLALLLFFFASNHQVAGQQLAGRSYLPSVNFMFNPGMNGIDGNADATIRYRTQWQGYEEAPTQKTATFQIPFLKLGIAAGGFLQQENAAGLQRTNVGLTTAYRFRPNLIWGDYLSIGIMASIESWSFNPASVIVNDLDDQLISVGWGSKPLPSFGAGLFYTSNKDMGEEDVSAFYFGLGSNQLWAKDVFDSAGDKIFKRVFTANATLGAHITTDKTVFVPSLWAEYSAPNIVRFSGSVLFELTGKIWTGLSLGSDGAVAVQLGPMIELGEGFIKTGVQILSSVGGNRAAQGYSYDFVLGYSQPL